MGSMMGWYNRDWYNRDRSKEKELEVEIAKLREAVKARDKLLQEIAPDVSYHCFAWFEEQRAALCNKS